ncbi:hypothetical protein, partial [Streptomyces beijiangensis]
QRDRGRGRRTDIVRDHQLPTERDLQTIVTDARDPGRAARAASASCWSYWRAPVRTSRVGAVRGASSRRA